jgi:hydroxymethylpyrimidine/phosphomethylpyrimidine kinase
MTSPAPPVVLVLAGLDPSGGAGLAADIQTLAIQGCHAAPVATALTVQDSVGVQSVNAVDVALVEQQARAVINDLPIAAIKTGLLASVATIELAAQLARETGAPLIVDPVLASGGGVPMSDESLDRAYTQTLLPLCLLTTPNTLEAAALGRGDDVDSQASAILESGCKWVLVTGTHESGPDIVHRLYHGSGLQKTIRQPRLPGEFHGSGCTLAAACAAGVALGLPMETVVTKALAFTQAALQAAFTPGHGQSLPNRLP